MSQALTSARDAGGGAGGDCGGYVTSLILVMVVLMVKSENVGHHRKIIIENSTFFCFLVAFPPC